MSTNEWSLPETELFGRIRSALEAETSAVLATVVEVEGSAYRRPGAKMLVDTNGGAGSLTAGCLEDDVRALAEEVLAAGEPVVETWDLTGDDDVWGMGVGCNGVVTVLLEPLDENFAPVAAARAAGDPVGVATVVGGDLPLGTRAVYRPGERFAGELPAWLSDRLHGAAESIVEAGDADTVTVEFEDRTVEVFLDGIRPPPELVVFGSGHDVNPVVELAKQVDFRVTVATFRGAQATAERFPAADRVVSTSAGDAAAVHDWDDDSYAVVMSHNFVDDRFALEDLLTTEAPYVGLMGPRERFEEMREAFDGEGVTFSADQLERVYTPIGLNLGGSSPYHIAYSIVAELLAVANDRTPDHLSRREGPIHERVDVRVE